MKFKIRYADQIVGILAIVAILALVLVILLLGSKQRWFSKDYAFRSTFETASGMSVGMEIQYKGFTVGKIQSITLDSDNLVDVGFCIYDTYYDRAREGSVIELIVSPIGVGNSMLFHPGNGTELIREGSFIPRADSAEGIALIDSGRVTIPKRDDTITNVISQVQPLLTNINETLTQLNGAMKGTGKGPLAETMSGVATTMTNVAGITAKVNGSKDGMIDGVNAAIANVEAITANFETLSEQLKSPDGLVPRLIDPDGKIFSSLENSLKSVEGTLNNVEDSSSILKSEVPQIARLIEDLRIALVKGQDVLEALRNNPILKNGVPEKVESDSSGTNSRNIEF
jgi:phospholipid/cholesterol/gamma-HCH transport system substrate-binding protein